LQALRFLGISVGAMPGSIITALMWATLLLLPPILGYWLARIRSPMVRLSLLALSLPLPITLLTVAVLLAPPTLPSLFSWWVAGMIMISPAIVIWAGLAGTAYFIGRRTLGQIAPAGDTE